MKISRKAPIPLQVYKVHRAQKGRGDRKAAAARRENQDQMVNRAHVVIKETPVTRVNQDKTARQEREDHVAHVGRQAVQAKTAKTANKDPKVNLVNVVQRERRDPRERMDNQVNRARMVNQEQEVPQDPMESMETKAHRANPDQRGHVVARELMANQDHVVHKGNRANAAQTVNVAQQALRVKQASQAMKDHVVKMGNREPMASVDVQEVTESQVRRARLETKVMLDKRVPVVLLVTMVNQASQAEMVSRVRRDLVGRLDQGEIRERRERRVAASTHMERELQILTKAKMATKMKVIMAREKAMTTTRDRQKETKEREEMKGKSNKTASFVCIHLKNFQQSCH